MKEDKNKKQLVQELRDLIIRNFQMANHLSIVEVRELLKSIPELESE